MKRSTVNLLLGLAAVFVVAELLDPNARAAMSRRKLTRGELVKLARDVGFPDAQFAADIAMRESGGDPGARNDNPPRERSFGLWQINILAHPKYQERDLYDPKRNAEAAFEVSRRGTDWTPWSTFKPPLALPAEPDFQP